MTPPLWATDSPIHLMFFGEIFLSQTTCCTLVDMVFPSWNYGNSDQSDPNSNRNPVYECCISGMKYYPVIEGSIS